MSGSSIVQAREALELAIARLGEQDSFNVVEFNSYAKALYADARPATAPSPTSARSRK
jgi:Ca-activated chloride channel family protein